MDKFESGEKQVPYNINTVYNKISNLENLKYLYDHLPSNVVQDITIEGDTVSINVPVAGKISMRMIKIEEPSRIEFETINSTMPFVLSINLKQLTAETCGLKVIVEIDLNPFTRSFVKKPLQDGLEKMAETLSVLSY